MTKKILVLFELPDEQKTELKELTPDYELTYSVDAQDDDVEIVYGYDKTFEQALQSGYKNVRWVQYPYAGVNKLPLGLMASRNILLTNGSGIHAHSMTEVLFGHLLSYTRQFKYYEAAQQHKHWGNRDWAFDLLGRTMLIIGTGNVGQQVAKVAQAFGMHTLGINRSGHEVRYFEKTFAMDDLKHALSLAEVIVNLLPLTPATKHLFDAEVFDLMQSGVIFINMGRGQSVVTADLVTVLKSGQVAFAGLDVFEEEPLSTDHELWSLDNVSITPHVGGNVENYPRYLFPIFIENLKAYQQNKKLPRNLVDLKAGY